MKKLKSFLCNPQTILGLIILAVMLTLSILAPVICMLAAPLKNHLTPGARFICSGIIAEAEEDVNTALLEAGYIIDEIQHKGDWVAFACHI